MSPRNERVCKNPCSSEAIMTNGTRPGVPATVGGSPVKTGRMAAFVRCLHGKDRFAFLITPADLFVQETPRLVIEHDHGTYTFTSRQHPETVVDFIEPDAARNQLIQFQAAFEVLVNEPRKIAHGPCVAVT